MPRLLTPNAMHGKRPAALYFAFVMLAWLAVSCSKSTEAVTRPKQEEMFRELFGFEPPSSVAEIKYQDVYDRQLMNGSWGRWMRFTYREDVLAKILEDRRYKKRDELRMVPLESPAAPAWWPKVDQSKVTIYLRTDQDDKDSRGYSFEEYLWRDTNSNFVYFHKRYWN